jgi:hypothetical protein
VGRVCARRLCACCACFACCARACTCVLCACVLSLPFDTSLALWRGRVQYGDNSAVMGNDFTTRNSFTPPARWRLGWLPDSSILTTATANGGTPLPAYGVPFTLTALSLGPNTTTEDGLVAMLPCPNCQSRILDTNGSPRYSYTGGFLWLSFRGDTST